ncbi:hypothetical protein [Allopusillimonas ginsengisoli]|uniref:hypothetical protein n=1 Tax=Allopusillimonas ginsengisoli TaxID=453575 RepID=UPI0010226AAB|nr:hypothetical protein [Allopusillimonas ginsengisoli]TEA74171.1 hypothetical protein ERE07_19020 [Allopusillimonas ginsengisoli]
MSESAPVTRYRTVLAALDPRISLSAQLRALFPLIEVEMAAGVPHAAVLDDLAAAGLTVQRSTFAITLYRWRKAQRSATRKRLNAAASVDDMPSQPTHASNPHPPSPTPDAIQGRPRSIQTPGDLRKIRDMRVDLEALRREGLANRTQSADNTPTKRNEP